MEIISSFGIKKKILEEITIVHPRIKNLEVLTVPFHSGKMSPSFP
jgi:hypothetical protein